jgi:hypothetical protein
MNNDYQYMCVLIGGGSFITDWPVLALPGSYIYMNHDGVQRRFYVAEYWEPIDHQDYKKEDFDLCVYCDEVPNTVNIKQIRRDLKINNILK